MFDELHLSDFKQFRHCVQKQSVLEAIDAKLRDVNRQVWSQNLYKHVRIGRNKLRTYRQFKSDFATEMYLKKPLPFKVRQCFAALRCGTAPLRIETGRYEGLNEDERLCQVCENNTIENEMHFLMLCPAYNNERQKLLQIASQVVNGFYDLSMHDQFVILMKDANLCHVTARACYKMFSSRKSLLFK